LVCRKAKNQKTNVDTAALQSEIEALAAQPGIKACALVDRSSGLVLHQAGEFQSPALWEAAVEYWRLHSRVQEHFAALGGLRAVITHHAGGMLVLLPCGAEAEYLLACVGTRYGVDWRQWQLAVRQLAQRIEI
jgi:hypothetical protein